MLIISMWLEGCQDVFSKIIRSQLDGGSCVDV